MKKAIIISYSFFTFLSFAAFSQSQNLNSAVSYYETDYVKYNEAGSLQKAKEKIDLAAANESTKEKAKTWHFRGLIYLASFDQNLKVEVNKNTTEKDYTKKLLSAYLTFPTDLLDEAVKSFQKEIELDDKKVYSDEAKAKIKSIAGIYSDKALSYMLNKNYDSAIPYYEKSIDTRKIVNATIDTSSIYNLAVAARNTNNLKKTEELYDQLISMKYDKPEKWYLEEIRMYSSSGDTTATRKMVIKARTAMPDNYDILVEEMNLYTMGIEKASDPIQRKNLAQKAIVALNTGISKNPKEAQLHLVLASVYNKLAFPKEKGNNTNYMEYALKAEDEYKKAIDLKQDFQTYSTLGIYYHNWCAFVVNQLESIKDPKKAKEQDKLSDELLSKAIPMLEKAHELDPTDRDVMVSLRQDYVRSGKADTEKYKKLDAELKGGKK
ncbi:MAG TPA: hypothetical protein VII99_12775 [Bacteroidia bacterium]